MRDVALAEAHEDEDRSRQERIDRQVDYAFAVKAARRKYMEDERHITRGEN